MLRAGASLPNREYRHSSISTRLYGEVLEAEWLLSARLGKMIASAALNSHPDTDISKAGDGLRTGYFAALNALPYLTGGKSAASALHEERMSFVEEYKAWAASMEPPVDNAAPRKKKMEIESVSKGKKT